MIAWVGRTGGRGSRLALGALAALAWAGCGTDAACEAQPPGLARDQCLHDALLALPADRIAEVESKASKIQDPMIQQAGISAWARAHAAEVPRERGERLCEILEGRDKAYCLRCFSSPHLQRP